MSEYKCINCGTVRETTEESSMRSTCSNCGYRMFEMPYDRKDVLRSEIIRFLNGLRPVEIKERHLSYQRMGPGREKILKSDDDDRFPGYKKIRKYVCASEKTEEFCERLEQSIREIRKHITTPYSQHYDVKLERLLCEISGLDEILVEAIKKLKLSVVVLPEVRLPEFSLCYSETPDDVLSPKACEVLDLLAKMPAKIKRFIKRNNVYGTVFRYEPNKIIKLSKNKNYSSDLEKACRNLEELLNKNYVIDIFDDGTEELQEMLDAVWNSIWIIMSVPVLAERYDYSLYDGNVMTFEDVSEKILNQLARRYSDIEWEVSNEEFLAGKTEDELFELYDGMIELDKYGILGVSNESLLKTGKGERELNKLAGLSGIKESIKKIKAYALANKESKGMNLHMCFYGNPGTGKTQVARIIAKILHENEILPTGKVVEVDRGGLVGQYVGETAQKTMQKIEEAMGGVLFVDEAYALIPSDSGGFDYGHEAVAALIKAMEDHRGEFCVILAGYRNEMQRMLKANPGFRSRIQFELDFPNYSRDELGEITKLMLADREYTISDIAIDKILDITDIKRKEPNFANAREIRNILDQVIMCQNLRCMGTENKELGLVDVNKYIKDSAINLPTTGEGVEKKLLSGEEELEQLVGLASVKRIVKKIRAYAKRNKNESDFNIHMCFYGNPGTGKTEVARILSRILYDSGVLGEAKLVETDAHGLIGKYVGETAPKTLDKINEAMNGVLFIDEAYSLAGLGAAFGGTAAGHGAGYGDEAIAVLLKEMEDRRGQFCVILAGYKNEMKAMLNSNPGFKSRIQFAIEFPDYTRKELGEIALGFLSKKKYTINEDALIKVLDITDYFRARPNFANARTVRNILDQVIMNQNLRAEDDPGNVNIVLSDVEEYLMDEGIELGKSEDKGQRIGFV